MQYRGEQQAAEDIGEMMLVHQHDGQAKQNPPERIQQFRVNSGCCEQGQKYQAGKRYVQ